MHKVLILGATGLVGTSLKRKLEGSCELLTPSREELDLMDSNAVNDYFYNNFPDRVYLCAAKVGGILANRDNPVEFFNINMQIGMNVLSACYQYVVKKVMVMGSTCIYPKNCPQPMKEEYLLTDELEPTNEAYALAKISTLRLAEYYNKQYGTNFISVMPTNLFGIGDNYHPTNSHLIASVIRKVRDAKLKGTTSIEIWGDGTAQREFMFSDDLADALVYLMETYDGSQGFINIGTGKGKTITEIYKTVMKVMGYDGELTYDKSKPNGTMKKLTDISKLTSLGWESKFSIEEGIRITVDNLEKNNYQWKEV